VGRWFPGGVYDTKHLSGGCSVGGAWCGVVCGWLAGSCGVMRRLVCWWCTVCGIYIKLQAAF
jgi:hypothetical protein